MSHGDQVVGASGFRVASTPVRRSPRWKTNHRDYAVQFHPEVAHDRRRRIIRRFARDIVASGRWTPQNIVADAIARARTVGMKKWCLASRASTRASSPLLSRAIGDSWRPCRHGCCTSVGGKVRTFARRTREPEPSVS
jgi:hypothetical protein